jgi:hypothetical protein
VKQVPHCKILPRKKNLEVEKNKIHGNVGTYKNGGTPLT